MADVAFVLIIIAFFGLAAGFVHVCDRIIGADEKIIAETSEHPQSEQVAA